MCGRVLCGLGEAVNGVFVGGMYNMCVDHTHYSPLTSQCRNLKLYKDYVEMYKKSVDCLNKHKAESPQFKSFIEVRVRCYDNYLYLL